jgi:putative sigma-54 modulation protein
MNLTIRSHNTSVYEGFSEHATKKLDRLERLLQNVGDVIVEVKQEETRSAAHRYAVQVTVHAGRSTLRAEERGADPRVALDLVADVLSRQARRQKKRLDDREHARGAKEAAAETLNAAGGPEAQDQLDEYVLGNIVRVKHFDAPAMTREEALVQLDLLGHDFFLFLDAATRDYALLYKRKDGKFGLLSPRRG